MMILNWPMYSNDQHDINAYQEVSYK